MWDSTIINMAIDKKSHGFDSHDSSKHTTAEKHSISGSPSLSVCVCVCVLFVRYFYTMSADRHTAAHKQLVIN